MSSGWGSGTELSPMETLMWRADVDPTMRSTVTAVELLDSEPDWERLVAAHAWASRVVPRFRDRVVDPLGPLGTPVWERADVPDLRYHLRRVALPDASLPALFDLAAQLAMTPFDRARPPWEAVLVTGLPGGRAAYVLKLHHALTDGMGLAQLLTLVHSQQRAHDPAKPEPDVDRPAPPSVARHVVRQVRHDAAAVAPTARRLARALSTPRQSAAYAASARRVLSPPDVPGLPLLRNRGTSWRFVAVDVELADLKAAARAPGGTVNDGFLAALVGAFRIYHERLGTPLAEDALMPVSAPVSVRSSDADGGGNHIAPARVAGPVGDPDPARRIATVGAAMRRARDEPGLRSTELVAPLLARLPAAVVTRVGSAAMAANDLQASNVPGIQHEVFLAGARIERIYGFAPLPGCAAMISMASHGPTLCVGANLDGDAITDAGLFGECLVAGFAEVLALADGATPPRLVS